MQFTQNMDYPPEGSEVRPLRSCGPPEIHACDRFRANVLYNGRPVIAEVVIPVARPIRPAQGRNNNNDSDSDDSDTDTDDDDDVPRRESIHGYWLQRTLRPAIYGSVWGGSVLRRLDDPIVTDNGESVSWEVTSRRCAVKIYSRRNMRENRGSAENPMTEISAMQYLLQYQRRRFQPGQIESDEQMMESALTNSFQANVMMPYGVYYNSSDIFSVMPYCDGGELFDVLDERRRFPEPEARYWMHQILSGVETLQRAGICHRDMSLENLLTDSTGRALVIDMGMSIKIPYVDNEIGEEGADDPMRFEDHRERQRCLIRPDRSCGKPYYMSPEIRQNKEPFDGHAVDMWAIGPILFLMVAGFPPWEIADNSDERFYYFSNGYLAQTVATWNLGLSADLIDLLQRMFFINPRDRLSLEQVRAHPWMQGEVQPPPPRGG